MRILSAITTYDSLAAFEKSRKQWEADSDYQEFLAEVRKTAVFVAGSIVQSLYESLS